MFAATFREPWVIQKFLPEVKDGDKRIILVDGVFAGAVNRVPAADDLRSNMVRGGSPKETELSPREREICRRRRRAAPRARPAVRRHRCDRRPADRDQCHVSHRDPCDQEISAARMWPRPFGIRSRSKRQAESASIVHVEHPYRSAMSDTTSPPPTTRSMS